jgi:hypothetical protein
MCCLVLVLQSLVASSSPFASAFAPSAPAPAPVTAVTAATAGTPSVPIVYGKQAFVRDCCLPKMIPPVFCCSSFLFSLPSLGDAKGFGSLALEFGQSRAVSADCDAGFGVGAVGSGQRSAGRRRRRRPAVPGHCAHPGPEQCGDYERVPLHPVRSQTGPGLPQYAGTCALFVFPLFLFSSALFFVCCALLVLSLTTRLCVLLCVCCDGCVCVCVCVQEENEIDWDALRLMNEAHLKELGFSMGPRVKIINSIGKWKPSASALAGVQPNPAAFPNVPSTPTGAGGSGSGSGSTSPAAANTSSSAGAGSNGGAASAGASGSGSGSGSGSSPRSAAGSNSAAAAASGSDGANASATDGSAPVCHHSTFLSFFLSFFLSSFLSFFLFSSFVSEG